MQGAKKHRKLEKVIGLLENNFNVIGSTAVQDNLQDNVKETLLKFRQAGISTWVLTGDKEETATNVGFAAGLLTNDTERVYLTSSNT